jgi:hypothetical protein
MEKHIKRLAILTIGLGLLACPGCGKKSATPDFSHPVVGEWSWVESVGGIAGVRLTPQSEGYTKKQVFRRDTTFLEYRNDSLIFSAKYSISKKVVWNSDTAEVLEIEGFSIEQIIGFQGNDSLELTEHCIDCFEHLFIRIDTD